MFFSQCLQESSYSKVTNQIQSFLISLLLFIFRKTNVRYYGCVCVVDLYSAVDSEQAAVTLHDDY